MPHMKTIALKVMMLGEIGVGKTSIARRLVFDSFETSYKATIGVDIYSFSLGREVANRNLDVDLLIWDVDGDLGQEIFNHIYIKGAHAALIVSDVTRIATYKTAIELASSFERHLPGRPAHLVMNKTDLVGEDKVNTLLPAVTVGFDTLWTSAKTGHHVAKAFASLAQQCLSRGIT